MLKKIVPLLLGLALSATVPASAQNLTGSQIDDATAERLVLLSLSEQTPGGVAPTQDDLNRQAARVAAAGFTGSDATALEGQSNHYYQLDLQNRSEFDAGTITYSQFLSNQSTELSSAMNALQGGMSGGGYSAFSQFVQAAKNNMQVGTDSSGSYSAYYVGIPGSPDQSDDTPQENSDEQQVVIDATEDDTTCNLTETGTTSFTGGNTWLSGLGYVVGSGVGNPTEPVSAWDGSLFILDSLQQVWQYQNQPAAAGGPAFSKLNGKVLDVASAGAQVLYGVSNDGTGTLIKYSFATGTWSTVTGKSAGSSITHLAISPSNRMAVSTNAAGGGYGLYINPNAGITAFTQVGTVSTPIVKTAVGTIGSYGNGVVYFFLTSTGVLYAYQPSYGLAIVTVSGVSGQIGDVSASDDHTIAVATTAGNIYKTNIPAEPKTQGLSFTQVPGSAHAIASDSISDLYVINHSSNTIYQRLPNSTGTANAIYEGTSGRTLLNVQNNITSNLPIDNTFTAGGVGTVVQHCIGATKTVFNALFNDEVHWAYTKMLRLQGQAPFNCHSDPILNIQVCSYKAVQNCTVTPMYDPSYVDDSSAWAGWYTIGLCARPAGGIGGSSWSCVPAAPVNAIGTVSTSVDGACTPNSLP